MNASYKIVPFKDGRPKISLIVAMAKNRAIGFNGHLPWHLPSDLKRFRELTMGHVLLMGRRTFESIGKVLDGRRTLVLTRNASYRAAGVEIVADIPAALNVAAGAEQLFVCGGGEVYRQCLDLVERIYLTQLTEDFDGDCFFPELSEQTFDEVQREKVADSSVYYFSILERSVNSKTDHLK